MSSVRFICIIYRYPMMMMMSGVVVVPVYRRTAVAPVNLPSRGFSSSSQPVVVILIIVVEEVVVVVVVVVAAAVVALPVLLCTGSGGSVSRTRRRRRSGSPPGSHGNVRSIAMGFSRAPCVPVRLLCAQWFLNRRPWPRPTGIHTSTPPPITISLYYAPFVLHTNNNNKKIPYEHT